MSSAFSRPKTVCFFRTAPAALVVGTLLGSFLVVSPAAAVGVDITAPAAVSKISVSVDSSRIKLDWSSNRESDLAGYLVYRSTSADGQFTQLTATPRTSSDYSDTSARAGYPTYYRVVAVDKSGNQSTAVSAIGTRKDGTKPAVPTSATVKASGSAFVVDWADNTDADLAGYIVSRATSSGGSYTKLTSTPVASSTFTDTSVPAGKTPYYKISAVDLSGNTSSTVTVTVPDTTAPTPVRSMKVTAGTSSVKLDWSSNSESDLAGYNVYRAASADGVFTKLTSSPRSSSDFTDSTAPAGIVSYYRVVAVDKAGNESAPVSATGTRKDGVAPAAPKALNVVAGADGIVLDWADSTEPDLAGYVVFRSTSLSGTYTKLTGAPIASSTYVDAGAPAGTTSYYRVTAVDASGNVSSYSTGVATRSDSIAPAAVRSMTVTADTSRIKLDWASNTDSDLAGYVVYRSASVDGTFTRVTASTITASDYTDTTAPVGVVTYYRVVAIDKSGNESVAVATSGTRRDGVAPVAPKSLTATVGDAAVTLDWADNAEADLAGYTVSRSTSSGGTYTKLTATPVDSSTFVDTTAPAGATVYYRVSAVDASGNVSSTTSVTAVPKDVTAPVAVRSMKVSADTSRVKLDWSSNGEPDLAGYVVYRSATVDGTFVKLTASPVTSSEYSDTTGMPGITYQYRVVAVDKTGNESVAITVAGTRRDSIAPLAVTSLTAEPRTDGIALDWADSTEADLAGYVVSRSATSGGTYTKLTATPITGSAYVDAAAPAGVTSYYRVTAVDASGNMSATASVSAMTADTLAPGAPAQLTATGTATGIRLAWAKNTEADVAGYRISRADSVDGEYVDLTSGSQTAVTFLDVTAPVDRSVFYRVVTIDRSGNVSEVSTVEGIPADTIAPVMPVDLVATGTAGGVELDWADNAESDLAGYRVTRIEVLGTGSGVLVSGLLPIAASSYLDADAVAGVAYRYSVVAVDRTGNSSTVATAVANRIVVKTPIAGADVTVAQDGSGDYTTIAAAMAAAPASASVPFAIGIRPGTYRELLTVTRSNVTLFGSTANASDVVISYGNASGTVKPDGSGTYGTSGSATMLIKGSNVTAKNLTIENSYKETGTGSEQAVALKTTGDRLVFDNVRLLGDQDTLYVDSPTQGAVARSYFVNSYIEGDVDFIFGRGTAVFDRSTLKAATRGSATNNGYVTAASTDKSLTYGYLITDSTITSDAPANSFNLGRPWQPSADANAIAQVVVRNTVIPAAIKSSAWTDMTTTFSWRDARFAEYQNTGAGAVVNGDRPQLTDAEAAKYTKFAYLEGTDGWNPTDQLPPVVVDAIAPTAPATPTVVTGHGKADLSWSASTETDLAGYNLYRSDAGAADTNSAKVNTTGLLTGTAFSDAGLVNGTTYRWVLTAVDKAGNESPISVQVAGTPVEIEIPAHDILVAADGTGDYTTVQAAISAATAGTAAKPTVIAVKPGTYRELLTLSKSYVTVIGATGDAKDVVFTYDNAGGTTNPATGAIYGTGASQSVLVSGSNITMRDLTIENAFDEAAVVLAGGEQAVALKTTGDRLVFDNVRLLGNQDTLLVDSPDAPVQARSYFKNSYIQGDVDFIFGRGTAVFDRSTIAAMSRGSNSNNGYITAASTSDKNSYGFLITDSTITSNAPANTFSLGRPWRGWSDGYTKNGVVYNSRGQVTVRDTVLPAAIRSTQPWADMSPNLWTDGRFSEYDNTGAGATENANRRQLTDAQAAGSTKWTYLAGTDGWNPTGEKAPVVADVTAPAAPASVTATAADSKAVLGWSAPADTDVTGYNVYRSTAGATPDKVNGSLVTGTAYTDVGLTNGGLYSYTVTAVDAAGNESVVSGAASVTPALGDTVAPAVPTGVVARLGKGTVTVSWTAGSDADLASYTVFRSPSGGVATKVGSVTGATSFTDTTAVIGTRYSYTVSATDTSANESATSVSTSAVPVKADVIVASDGTGDATTLQAGINLLADNADYTTQGGRVILVQPGTYTGGVTSGNRYGVTIVGASENAKDTVITAGATGTAATVTLSGKNWTLKNLTVANTNAAATQGTALQIKSGDKQVFDNVRFLGDGQVLQVSTANVATFSRAYFNNVYVEGGADMIIGRAVAVFTNSTFHVLNRPGASITDSSIAAESPYGFLIADSKIVTDGNPGSIYLGRPYSTQGKAQVIIRNTDLGAAISTAKPWKDWDATTTWTAGRFFEFQNTGAGAVITDPATRPQLSEADAADFTAKSYLVGTDGWNPVG